MLQRYVGAANRRTGMPLRRHVRWFDVRGSTGNCWSRAEQLPHVDVLMTRCGSAQMLWLMERIAGLSFSVGGCKRSAFWSACIASPIGPWCLSSGIALHPFLRVLPFSEAVVSSFLMNARSSWGVSCDHTGFSAGR
jgi:hypothetical protein